MGRLLDRLATLELALYNANNVWHVNGDNTSGDGTKANPFEAIQEGIDAASAKDCIIVWPQTVPAGDTDPVSYTENLIVPVAKSNLTIFGVNGGRAQGGLPQLKVGTTTTQALLTVRAPGCKIENMGFNGAGATGGGILLDDDGSTKVAFGTTIENCHFKNCVGTTATNAATGGAIQWAATGGAWQTLIKGCRFYKNVGDVVLLGTSGSVPQDVVIEDCIFSGPAANVDCNLYLAGGSGMNGVIIRNCSFGQLPAIGSGTNVRYIIATGCVGMLEGCTFGCQTSATGGTPITFKADGTGALIPTTMHIVKCYGQSITASETAEISIA